MTCGVVCGIASATPAVSSAATCPNFYVSSSAGYQSVVARGVSCKAAKRLLTRATRGRYGANTWRYDGYTWRAARTVNVIATRIVGRRGTHEVRGTLVIL